MLKLLVVSYAFPPQAEVGALRLAHLCRYLPEYGIQPVVLTVQERFYSNLDRSIPFPREAKVVRTPVSSTPLDLYKRWFVHKETNGPQPGRAVGSPAVKENASAIRKNLIMLLQTPDPYWGWIFPAKAAVDKLVELEKPDAVFSSGPPWASHIVAKHVKLTYGLPWFADYRDPWAHNETIKAMPAWRQWLDLRLEASCVRRTDLIICNTQTIRGVFRKAYPEIPEEKFAVLSNGFAEPEAGESVVAPALPEGRRIMLHTGGLYSTRRVDTFMQAILHLAASRRLNPAEFDVLLLGPADANIQTAGLDVLPEQLQRSFSMFQPAVSWAAAQEIMHRADLLLLFQGTFRAQIPAKFFEYLRTGKPVFAVAEKGALTDLIEETKSGQWADPANVSDIAEKLMLALRMPARSPEAVRKDWDSRFNYQVLTGYLAGWVKRAVGQDQRSEEDMKTVDAAVSKGK